jgi:electron transfer flavoprotein beta subunit
LNVLVCVKRVPQTGGRIVLTPDGQAIDTKFLGFTVSPHEECAVEEAVRIVERDGGTSAVLTLGPAAAEEQLRDAMAIGIERAILLETDGREWDPVATAAAIVDAIRAEESANGPFDLVLLGNEAADTGDFQVGIRVAVALGRPVVNGIKGLSFRDRVAVARREAPGGGWELYELPLPAVVGVKEGINLPRYPSVPGRLRARKKEVERVALGEPVAAGPTKVMLRLPAQEDTPTEILGRGAEAAPAVVDLLERIGVVAR